ncbi:hypothetical protein NHX12_028148, partial [Muraenolepis orangiensis]
IAFPAAEYLAMEDRAAPQGVGGPAHVPQGPAPGSGPGPGPAHVLRCGWLKKQGGFVKTWHTRWFVLRRDQLHYYKDEEESKALGTISLPGNRVTEHATSGDEGGKFLFEIAPDGIKIDCIVLTHSSPEIRRERVKYDVSIDLLSMSPSSLRCRILRLVSRVGLLSDAAEISQEFQ